MLELIRVKGDDLINAMHRLGVNRVLVKPVDARISAEIILFEGQYRVVQSVRKEYYLSCGGSVLFVKFKPLPSVRLQGKDLSTDMILNFLYDHAGPYKWKSWWANTETRDWGDWSIANLFPTINQRNEIVLLRKMSRLIKSGYVHGCDCGCRGDFYLSDKGLNRVYYSRNQDAGNQI